MYVMPTCGFLWSSLHDYVKMAMLRHLPSRLQGPTLIEMVQIDHGVLGPSYQEREVLQAACLQTSKAPVFLYGFTPEEEGPDSSQATSRGANKVHGLRCILWIQAHASPMGRSRFADSEIHNLQARKR